MAKTHELKVLCEFFDSLALGIKTFELRKDDRAFRAGDILLLKEYNSQLQEYTGRELSAEITYIVHGEWGLLPDYVCMALKLNKEELQIKSKIIISLEDRIRILNGTMTIRQAIDKQQKK